MKKLLLNNWSLKLASVLLAALLWFLTVQIYDPQDVKTFSNIPVKLINTSLLDKQDKVYEVLEGTDTVRVTIKAPTSVIGQLRASDIVAEADVSRLTDINTVPITYSVQNVDSENITGDHDVVRLDVENRKTRWISVVSNTIGEVAEGYMVYSATPDQNRIEVSGPESVVNSVDHAGVEVDVTNATVDLSANVEITLYDAENQIVDQDNLTLNEKYMHMTVEVLAAKTVPVEVDYSGVPETGYVVTGELTVEPSSIEIAGRQSAIEGVSKITIPAEKLSIAGATEDVVETIRIRDILPENTRLADSSFNGRVTVTVGVEPIAEKTVEVLSENISIVNIPQGVEAELTDSLSRNMVRVSGLNARISQLQSGNIKGTVDVAAWLERNNIQTLESGVYTLPVELNLENDITQENDISVRVTITVPQTQEE
ncbi:MAG: hypothetical protein IJ833_03955 [Lachnospiraceae bacterium]|nr:hypothetical protein [Lachnospiraceae bacterium]